MRTKGDQAAPQLSLGWIFRQNRGALAMALLWAVGAEAAGLLALAAVCLAVVWAIDGSLLAQGMSRPLWLAAWLLAAILAKGLGAYLSTASAHKVAFEFLRQTRSRLVERLADMPLGFFNQRNTGQIKKILWEDVERLEAFIAHNIPDVLASAVNLILAAGLLLALDWRVGLAAVGVALGCGAVYGLATGRHRNLYEQWCEANENLNAAMIEYIQGMPAIKAFNRPSRFFAALGKAIDDCARLEKELVAKWYWPMAVFTVGSRAGLAAILPLGGWLHLQGELTTGALVMLLLLGFHFGSGFLSLLSFGASLEQNSAGITRINSLLAGPVMPWPAEGEGSEPGTGLSGRDLAFSYPQGPEALRGVDFSAPPGRVLALVGPSGSGKTTLARLMARFWDPDQGRVLFGEADARQICWPRLMKQVAFVFQDAHLFSGTIGENIALGRPEASREAIEACARQAQCHEFIAGLPQGYDTRIGDRGVQLSGGERQRLCIARALLKDAPVVIFDEATSFLDPLCEAQVQDAISRLCQGKTVVVIAHRMETVVAVDEIILMDQGLAVARGGHEELLAHSRLYAELWAAQQGAAVWKIGQGVGPADRGGRILQKRERGYV